MAVSSKLSLPRSRTIEFDPVINAQGQLTGLKRKASTEPVSLPTIDGKQMYLDVCILDYRNNGLLEAADILRPALERWTAHKDVLSRCAYHLPPEAWGSPENVSNWIVRGGVHGRASSEQVVASMRTHAEPSVFVFIDWRVDSFVGSLRGAALAEDGRVLMGWSAPDVATLRRDMMEGERATRLYGEHYATGFVPVDLIGFSRAQLDGHAAFQMAVLNYEFRLKGGKK